MNRRKFKLPSEADLRGHMRFAASKNIWVGIDFDGSGPAMRHALTLYEAVTIYAGAEVHWDQTTQIIRAIAPEYSITCCYVEDRIGYLARHAGRPCPVE